MGVFSERGLTSTSPSAPPSRRMTKVRSLDKLGLTSDSCEPFTNPNNPPGSSLVSMVTVTVVGDANLAPPVTESRVTVK